MRGELNGLQSLFLKVCPYAYYVHCYAHRLQLALVDASKEVVPVAQFFQKLIFIINTVDSSSKRHDELHDAQLVELARMIENGSIQTGQGANQTRSLKRPGDTRWGSHFGSIHSLMKLFNAVNFVIQDMASDGSVVGSIRADTSFSYLSSFEFVFILCMMKEILGITEGLGQALQKRSQDIVNVVRLVFATKECLRQLRSDNGWEEFFCIVVEFCVNHDTKIPDMKETCIMRGGRARHQPDHFTKEQYFRVEIFRATLDSQLHELDRRFNEKMMDLLSTSATLIPRNKFKSFKGSDICELVKKYYPADFSQQDVYGLENQLKLFVPDASSDVELKNISILTDLCQLLVETGRDRIYHLIDRLLRLLVTFPVSIASAERAFSSLKIIKTRLRNTMKDENLANNLVVHIEREIAEKYTFEDILAEFKSISDRKADL
ncbi:zinc finger protein 862 isoform X1 [Triticum aestivum]|uniref:zinc finger protein 862 isoform X1 n=1 Tax=Triticum aestivum TaxID=4565 RepID=UPI0003D459AA|nr:zinc finger protein 862-like isoform X1 [Triticum aestivum]